MYFVVSVPTSSQSGCVPPPVLQTAQLEEIVRIVNSDRAQIDPEIADPDLFVSGNKVS